MNILLHADYRRWKCYVWVPGELSEGDGGERAAEMADGS
jgi:hypothetical protein